ncbi:putative exported protein [Yersinia aldovae 670-83]|nr:putative exported protein [Yersinia aldovae 670-83]
MIISPLTYAENRPGFVCGKFNGHVMEVPDSYIIYWAEYEGASAWDPNFIYNKKGCDANFVVLPMIASWPDMRPGDQELWYKQGLEYEGLRMRVEPFKRTDTDITFKRDFFLRKQNDRTFDPVIYIDKLRLFFVKSTRKLFRAEPQDRNSPYWFDEDVNGYYWAEVNGRVPVVFDCQWLPLEKRYYICEAIFVMPEIGSLVRVFFTVEKLPQWRAIVSNTQQFLLSHIKR